MKKEVVAVKWKDKPDGWTDYVVCVKSDKVLSADMIARTLARGLNKRAEKKINNK